MIQDLMNMILLGIKILCQMKPSRQDIGKFDKISGVKCVENFWSKKFGPNCLVRPSSPILRYQKHI